MMVNGLSRSANAKQKETGVLSKDSRTDRSIAKLSSESVPSGILA